MFDILTSSLAKVWANRLIAGTKVWADVPAKRKDEVREELQARVNAGIITQEQYNNIVGDENA